MLTHEADVPSVVRNLPLFPVIDGIKPAAVTADAAAEVADDAAAVALAADDVADVAAALALAAALVADVAAAAA